MDRLESRRLLALTVNAGGNITANAGNPVTFAGAVSGGTAPYIDSWNFGDQTAAVGALNPTHVYQTGGTYSALLTVTDSKGVSGSSAVVVTVNNVAPTASVTVPSTGKVGVPVSLSASATDPSLVDQTAGFTYAWNFGDGTTGAGVTPVHVYAAAGTYAVSVTAKDQNGLTSSAASSSIQISTVTGGSTVHINSTWLQQQGSAPYVLNQTNTTYILDTNVTAAGTAFVVLASNVTLNLNGYTVTYGNSAPVSITNSGFETGSGTSVTGWNITGAPAAALAPNTNFLFGNQVLRLNNFSSAQTIISNTIPISLINHTYEATITPGNVNVAYGTDVTLSVIDSVTGKVLATGSSLNTSRGFSAVAEFTPTTTNPVQLKVVVTPPTGTTTSVDLDAATLNVTYDYGIMASRAWSGGNPGFPNLPVSVQNLYNANYGNTSNFTVVNGSIVQGQGNGPGSSALFCEYLSGLTINNVATLDNGMDTWNVDARYASGNIVISNSTFQDNIPNITDRMSGYATISLFNTNGNILVDGNTFLGAPQTGIEADLTNGYTLAINDNYISQNSLVSDAYGIILAGVSNFQVRGNTIKPQSGEGIMLDGYRDLLTNGVIQNNTVVVQERPNRETGNYTYARALRLRNTDGSSQSAQTNVDISGNSFVASCGPGYSQYAYAVWISYINPVGVMNNANVNIHDNTIAGIANTTDTSYRAYGLVLDGIDPGINMTIWNNVLQSNDTSLAVGAYNDGDDDYVTLIGNTFDKAISAPARTYFGISAGNWQAMVTNVFILGTKLADGATANIFWKGLGTKDLEVGSVLNVQVQNPDGSPASGATVQVYNSGHTLVYQGTSDAHGNALSIPLVTTTYTQTTTDPTAITSSNSPSFTITTTNGSQSSSVVLTPSNTMSYSLTVGAAVVTNSPPVASNQSVSVNENTTKSITLAATDPDGNALTYSIVAGPGNGSLVKTANGQYTYTPNTYFNGADSFTFKANDGSLDSNIATVSITVNPVNQQPVATQQSVVLPDSGQIAIALQGTDIETPSAALTYTVTAVPASGTLVDKNGAAVTVGETFVASAAILTYTLPTEVLGSLSTSFTFTVTDNGDPAGSNSNALTSAPAMVSIQTPANTSGILRISGATQADTFALSQTASAALHIVLNGAVLGSDIPIASLSAVEIFGRSGNDAYTVGAGIGAPISITTGNGNNSLSSGPTNLLFNGGTGANNVTVTTSAGGDSVSLSPNAGTISGVGYAVTLSNASSITVNANSAVSAILNDSAGNDQLLATPVFAVLSGSGFSNRINGAGSVTALSSVGSDVANLYDSAGSNSFTAAPTSATFAGTGWSNSALGFAAVTAVAATGTSDTANLSDSSGNNTFTATQTSGTFSGSGWSNAANGFTKVVATAASGTTDSATLSDTAGSNTFTATPTATQFFGTGFYNQAVGFASVTGNAHSGTTDTAYLYDAAGSNTFNATPTTASFTGTGLSETANGFSRVYGYAASGTTDSATLSDTSGSNTFTASPGYANFQGTGFYETAYGFASVTANAHSGTTDAANLSDASGSNTFTVSPTTATFMGTGLSQTANGFARVVATAAVGTTDSATLADGSGSNTFNATPTSAVFDGTGFHYEANRFASVTANAHSGNSDTARLSDTSGSNSFTATPTTATFAGSGWSEAANGFVKVIATAASGTTDSATLSDTAGSNVFTATPTATQFFGTGFYNQAVGFASVTGNAHSGTTDTAYLYDAAGSNTFNATPTTASFTGTGLSETANGFSKVYGYAASGTTDSATLSDTSGSNTFTASPGYANFQGTGFYETAYSFATVIGNAAAGTTDAANLSDASGSNIFSVSPTTATFTGTGLSETANGFARVVATAAIGTTDSATLADGSGSNAFTATPTQALFVGTTFHYEANTFATVTGNAHSGTSDTARLYDASGSNTFNATPTTASFTGTGLSETANGFAKVIANAASGTTDTGNFSDSVSSAGTFTGKPTTSSMVGPGFINIANGFVTVTATAASASDVANLFDSALGDLYTGNGSLGALTGSNYSISIAQYGTVNLTGALQATNKIHLGAIDYVLNTFGKWTPV